jgi:hypothetical protein
MSASDHARQTVFGQRQKSLFLSSFLFTPVRVHVPVPRGQVSEAASGVASHRNRLQVLNVERVEIPPAWSVYARPLDAPR